MDLPESRGRWQNSGVKHPETLVARVLAILSDGRKRPIAVLQAQSGAGRAEVNGALEALREAGLSLHFEPNECVAVAAPFAVLEAAAIRAALQELGRSADVEVVPILDSTNAEFLRRARGDASFTLAGRFSVLAAELQTKGRGRQGRSWIAQAGTSIAVSFARALPRGLGELAGLSLMCGLAVRDALLRAGVEIELKWPNDLLWRGQKLGGILIEVQPQTGNRVLAVIGVGINVSGDSSRTKALENAQSQHLPVSDLTAAGALLPVDRNRVIADLTDSLSIRLDQFLQAGFTPYMGDWNTHHAYRDQNVEMIEHGVVVTSGIARGVDAQGRLSLETDRGPLLIVAGDVSLRPRMRS